MTTLAVIIVSYNTQELLAQTLRSLYTALDPWDEPYRVVVVDNASSDGSAEMAAREFPRAELLLPGVNLGFAGANNLAMRHLGFAKGEPGTAEFVWLLNSDTEVSGDVPQQLVSASRAHPKVGVVGPRLEYGDGSFQHSAFVLPGLAQLALDLFPVPGRILESRLNGRYPQALWRGHAPFAVEMVLGAAMMVRGDTISEVGLFDEGYFMYMEEVDWCRRIGAEGWQILAIPDATVVHHSGKSTQKFREQMFVALWRSRLRYYDKWTSRPYRTIVRALVRAGMAWRMVATRRHSSGADKASELAALRSVASL